MFATLISKGYRQFFIGRPFKDGVPGFLRASILVAFHFYVWAAFWQLSGARRTSADDRLCRRLDLLTEAIRRLVRCCQSVYWTASRLLRR
ncbi:MAG: hypothetical protein H0W29_10780 [Gemmatimonadales bacterium]|nr:hypothetical protein [Gemmatimonadales bacterium]